MVLGTRALVGLQAVAVVRRTGGRLSSSSGVVTAGVHGPTASVLTPRPIGHANVRMAIGIGATNATPTAAVARASGIARPSMGVAISA